jgi:hypothetical protein
LRREALFILRRQDFRASQILFGVHVLLLLRLLFAGAFLTRGLRSILLLLRPALRSAEKQTGAENDGEAAAKWLAQRNLGMCVLFLGTAEDSAHLLHRPDRLRGTSDGGILIKVKLRDNGLF